MKKINKFLSIVLFSGLMQCGLELNAQSNYGSIRNDIRRESYNENTRLQVKRPTATKVKGSKATPGYVLYRNVVRRNLWLEGQGDPISQEVANKLPVYFRLSMKNGKGHYQFVEALQGGKLTSNHTVSPYIKEKRIITQKDSILNEWDRRFSTIGQWLITSDLDGVRVVEERAFEAKPENANLIYSFQPIYNDGNHVTGSYTDSWGLPIDIDESENHYYGSVVYITLNKEGLDSIVDHIDAKGLCRYNEYGADQTRYIFDEKERLVSVSSHNTVGDRINDKRGYHATLFEYNDDMKTCTVTHVDKNLTPILPNQSTEKVNFKKALIKFDLLGRESEPIIIE